MTTETTVRAVRHRRLVRLFGYPCGRLSRPARTLPRGAWSGGWVGCGPYSGRSRSCCITHPLGHFTVQGRLVWGVVVVCIGLLVLVSSINRYRSSTPSLSTQSSTGSLPRKSKSFLWRPYLEDGFPLRCFQRLPFPNVANQPCPRRDNWHTRGSSVPVLSY